MRKALRCSAAPRQPAGLVPCNSRPTAIITSLHSHVPDPVASTLYSTHQQRTAPTPTRSPLGVNTARAQYILRPDLRSPTQGSEEAPGAAHIASSSSYRRNSVHKPSTNIVPTSPPRRHSRCNSGTRQTAGPASSAAGTHFFVPHPPAHCLASQRNLTRLKRGAKPQASAFGNSSSQQAAARTRQQNPASIHSNRPTFTILARYS